MLGGFIKWRTKSAPYRLPNRDFTAKPPLQSTRRGASELNKKFFKPSDNMKHWWKKPSKENTWMQDLKPYTYTPLPPGPASIRLLRLKPAADASWAIRCSLFHTTLSSAPPYIALSYCWGDRGNAPPIFVENEAIHVTPNLKQALQRLRPTSGEDLTLWVDAICINQADIPERSVQTSGMRGIYQRAESVAIWVGLESNSGGLAVRFACELAACEEGEVGALVRDPAHKESLKALAVLFRRQYWWRIWVIQEVACARRSMVYCGAGAIPWVDLDRICDIMKGEEDYLSGLFYNRPSFVRTLTHGGPRSLQLSRYSPDLDAPPLLELLLSHKSKKSTDPKDKVYALLGICSTRDTFGAVDYSRSMRDVYTHTARHIITTSGRLDVICVKQHDLIHANLPSWAPDWSRPPASDGALVVGLQHHEPAFAAAGNSIAQFEFSDDGYVLRATGFVIDTITSVGAPFRQKGAPKDIGPALHVFHDWWNLFTESFSDFKSSSAQARFGRTITCGNWMFENSMHEQKLQAIFELSGRSSKSMLVGDDALHKQHNGPPSLLADSVASLVDENEEAEEDANEKEQRSIMINAASTMNRRRLFVSRTGVVGLAPWNAEVGDLICILLGCRFPVILRPIGGKYTLMGEAYVDGFMNGEAMAGLDEGRFELHTFQIH